MADAAQIGARQAAPELGLPKMPRHDIRLRHRVGAFEIDVDFTLSQPWTVLFGPSGSGKSTILRAIAGLFRPQFGRIISTDSEGRRFTLMDTGAGIFLPTYKRGVRLAPQHPSLFPHLSVIGNMTYGMRRDEERLGEVESLLDKFRLSDLADKFPEALSGGEAQRVNLARAVAPPGGRLLLLDEPFTGLDVPLRDELIANLVERRSRPEARQILSVTHDVSEAFQLNAGVIKIRDGRVVAQGPVSEVLAEERTRLLQQLSPEE